MKIINLLPPSEQETLKELRIYRMVRLFVIATFFTYLLMVFALIAGRFYMQNNLSGLDAEISAEQKIISQANNVELQKNIDNTNHIITDYNNLTVSNPHWAEVLTSFAQLVPNGVYVEGFSGNASTGKIDVTGLGITRDEVLQLHDNIAASPLFRDIDLPLDNLQKPNNTPFHYTFYLKNGSLSPNWKPAPVVQPKASSSNSAQ